MINTLMLVQTMSAADSGGVSPLSSREALRFGNKLPNVLSGEKKAFHSQVIHGPNVPEGLGSVVFPIYQTSTFRFESAEEGAKCFGGESDGFIYTRINNPTIRELEKTIALLHNGYDAIATCSGMGAVNIIYMSFLGAGKHIICHKTVYGPSRAILDKTYRNFGVEISFVDSTDINEVKAAIRPNTALIYLESPANPTISISDVPAICALGKEHKIPVVVDNTFLGPYLQRPLEQGADAVVESLTKCINGHADIVGGVVIAKDEATYKLMRPMVINLGTNMDPNQAFLVRRGIKTLPLRVDRAQENAIKVADFLENHPQVEWIRFPGLKSHPQHDLAKRLMKGPGSMISFGVKGGLEGGRVLLNSLKFCVLAVSLGGVETLIQHPASMTHAKLSQEARLAADITDDLVRLSVGIEEVDDIIADLSQALDKVAQLNAK